MPKPLTEEQKEAFQTLKAAMRAGQVALISSEDKRTGDPVAVIVCLVPDRSRPGVINAHPLAVVWEDRMFDTLEDPTR
jgi:hypothetical protein